MGTMNAIVPYRTAFFAGLSAALLLFLAACAAGAGDPLPPAPTAAPMPTSTLLPTPTPHPRGGNLTVRLAADVAELRPWQPRSRGEEQIIDLLYSGLMRLDPQLRPQPDLARTWQAAPDGRVLTFTLRSGLAWHDGEPLDSADVLFTFEQLQTLPYTSTALINDLRYIERITAPSPRTVVMTLTERYAPLLAQLSLPILPEHVLAGRDIAQTDFWDVPVGSGPFMLAERDAGQSVVFERFAGYHHGEPLLDRVAFVVVPDSEASLAALEDERLLLAELPWSAGAAAAALADLLQLASYPENGFFFLGFNLREGRPFAEVALRRALAQAIDLERLVTLATKGQGMVIGNSAAPGSWADLSEPQLLEANLEAARATLETAGWSLPDGSSVRQREGITLTARLYVRGDDERRVLAARSIAEAARSIGMLIEVEPADFESVIISKYTVPFDFDLLLGSWSNGAGDPAFADYMFYDPDDFALFHSSQRNQGSADTRITRNFVGFSDSAYDNQAQAARQFYRIEERQEAYALSQARIAEALPYLYLWADRIPVTLNRRVTTVDGPVDIGSPLYFWNIERWYIE
jgi:peptide/nickel transport system substrate-binding protein